MNDDTLDGGNIAALRDLVQSPGWQLFLQHVEAAWGAEATLQRIEAKVATVPLGNPDAVQDMTQHVLSAQKAIRALVAWPAATIKALEGEKPSRQPFAALRRITR